MLGLEFLIVGVVVSLIVEAIKRWLGTAEYVTLAVVVVLALAGAALQWYLQKIGFWQDFLQILITAGAFYTFIIERFKKAV